MSAILHHCRQQFDAAIERGDWAEAARFRAISVKYPKRVSGSAGDYIELANLNWSAGEIAAKYGVSRETVATVINRARQEGNNT